MIYLKSFNESVDYNELKEFCEMNLAYLLDQGFEVIVTLLNTNNYSVEIRKSDIDDIWFNWNDVKDYIIPFLIRLKGEYEIKGDYHGKTTNFPRVTNNAVQFFVKVERTSHGKVLGGGDNRHVSNSVNSIINDNVDSLVRMNPIGGMFFTVVNK
jgi:hypothetical protein